MAEAPLSPEEAARAWYKDGTGRVRNDALGLWFAVHSHPDETHGRFLRAEESRDAVGVARFPIWSCGRELTPEEKAAHPGLDYELIVEAQIPEGSVLPGYGLDMRQTVEAAIRAQRGEPALYRMAPDRNYYARVSVAFVAKVSGQPTF